MTPIQLMLEDISKRYDPAYADRIQMLTQAKLETYPPDTLDESVMQIVSLYGVMEEEGFGHSERGAIFARALEHLTGTGLSAQAWQEILDTPVYELSRFSAEVREELKGLSNPAESLY